MVKKFPPRKKEAMTGSQFIRLLTERGIKAYGPEYEKLVLEQIKAGNVPDFMRPENWREVTIKGKLEGGAEAEITIRVCPDYIAIGSNEDYVRVPLSAVALQRLAARLDAALPTKKVVDEIDKVAAQENSRFGLVTDSEVARKRGVKIDRKTSVHMIDPEFVAWQSEIADEKIAERKLPRSGRMGYTIVSGHKKDVIVYDSPRPTRLVQYRPPEQGLDTGAHPNTHTDYSLGGRLVDQQVRVKMPDMNIEMTTRYEDIIKHGTYYRLLSDQCFDISKCYTISRQTVPKKKTEEAPPQPKKVRLTR